MAVQTNKSSGAQRAAQVADRVVREQVARYVAEQQRKSRSGGGSSRRETEQRILESTKDLGATSVTVRDGSPVAAPTPVAIGSGKGGGYLVQFESFGRSVTGEVTPAKVSRADGQTEYQFASPFVSEQFAQKKAAATGTRGETVFVDTTQRQFTRSSSGQYTSRQWKPETITFTPELPTWQELDRRVNPSAAEKFLANQVGAFRSAFEAPVNAAQSGEAATRPVRQAIGTVIRLPSQSVMALQRFSETGSFRKQQLEQSQAFIQSQAAARKAEEAYRQQLGFKGQTSEIPVLSGFGIDYQLRRPSKKDAVNAFLNPVTAAAQYIGSGFTTQSRQKQQQFLEGSGAFVQEYRRAVPTVTDKELEQAYALYRKRQFGAIAGTEAALVGVGGVTEVVGRLGVTAFKVARTGIRSATGRVFGGVAVAGAIEGGAESIIRPANVYGRRATPFETFLGAAGGALSAGSISATQFRLDVARPSVRRFARPFESAINVLDPQEPLSDILGTTIQRQARVRGVRTLSLEPTVTRRGKVVTLSSTPVDSYLGVSRAKTRTNPFVSSIVSVRENTRTRPSVLPRTQVSSSVSSFVRPSVRVRVTPNVRITPSVPVFTETSIPVQPRITPRVSTNVKVITADLPPLFPPLFRFGGDDERRNARRTRAQRGAYTSSLSGRLFRTSGRSAFARFTGLGSRA